MAQNVLSVPSVVEAHIGFSYGVGVPTKSNAVGNYHYDLLIRLSNNHCHHFQIKFVAWNSNYRLGEIYKTDKAAVERMFRDKVAPFDAYFTSRLYARIADAVFHLPTYLKRYKMEMDEERVIEKGERIAHFLIKKNASKTPCISLKENGRLEFEVTTATFQSKKEWDDYKAAYTPTPIIESFIGANNEITTGRCFSLDGRNYNAPALVETPPSV
jgi:hypothetical protein